MHFFVKTTCGLNRAKKKAMLTNSWQDSVASWRMMNDQLTCPPFRRRTIKLFTEGGNAHGIPPFAAKIRAKDTEFPAYILNLESHQCANSIKCIHCHLKVGWQNLANL
jgi:hypothetical protein